jgi:hypothetical protein
MLSANDLRSRLSSFYQDASVRFSAAVLTMHFCKDHLAADLAKFRTYALHSHFVSNLDGNEWIYGQLHKKMHAAWPQCLLLAAAEFHLTLDPHLPFSAYVDYAIKIAARLQSQSTLKPQYVDNSSRSAPLGQTSFHVQTSNRRPRVGPTPELRI